MNEHSNSVTGRDRGKLCFITCESGHDFGQRIHHELEGIFRREGCDEGPMWAQSKEVWFPNREVKTEIACNIRGDDVYIVQCMDDPLRLNRSVNDNLMALISAIDAVRQSDADTVTAVIPQFPYSRQERKKTREGISARWIARLLEIAGADRVITLDIHAEAIAGFFQRGLLENLHASKVIIEDFRESYYQEHPHLRADDSLGKHVVVVSPDAGSADRSRYFAKVLRSELAMVDKERNYDKPGKIQSMRLVGRVKGRDVFMPDDMIATGGTLLKACRLLKQEGARNIYLATSLAFFNGNAVGKFNAAFRRKMFRSVIATDAVFRGSVFLERHPWYREVSIAPLFAQVIYNINHKRSVSELLG